MSRVSAFDAFAHDLRHCLREIVTQAQWPGRREGENLSPETRDALDRIAAAGIRADALVRAMAAYEDAEAHPSRQCAVSQLIARLQHDQRATLHSATLTIASELAPTVSLPSCLHSIFSELIGNAEKFGASEVHLAIRIERAELVADVRDNGIGIEPEYREAIFQPYRRLHARDVYPGFGLGLARASRLIKQLGGSLTVMESEPGRGSTFQLRFPLPVTAEDALA